MATLAPAPLAVSIANAAVMADCSVQHIRRLVKAGTLRAVHLGGSTSVRVIVADIERMLGLASGGDA